MTTERWTTTQVAEWCNIRPSTYRDYVSEGRAPGPLDERDVATGAKLYDAATVKAWHASRPGAGTRTDLQARGAATQDHGANVGQTSTDSPSMPLHDDVSDTPPEQRKQLQRTPRAAD